VEEILRIVDQKKAAIDNARPLSPETLRSLKNDFTVRYAHETTAIEGNTLTIYETKVVLEDGITIGGKSIREHLEVLNIRDVLNWLEGIVQNNTSVTEDTVREIHRIVMKGILPDDAGAWHVPPNWVKVPELMQDFSAWLERGPGQEHPVVYAAKGHVELVRIHPFIDGNGRTARLLTSLLLVRSGYPPAMYTSGNRQEYMQALDKAHMTGDVSWFVTITAGAVEFMEDRYLELIRQNDEAQMYFAHGRQETVDRGDDR